MKNNSMLEKTIRTASVLKLFKLEDLLISIPDAKESTMRKYLSVLVKNGNINRVNINTYMFLNKKAIKTRVGSAKSVIKHIGKFDNDFTAREIHVKSNTNMKTVKSVLNSYVKLGFLSVKRVLGRDIYSVNKK